jgi:hypothetical protein
MADAPDLGSGAARRGGSSPPSRIRVSIDEADDNGVCVQFFAQLRIEPVYRVIGGWNSFSGILMLPETYKTKDSPSHAAALALAG